MHKMLGTRSKTIEGAKGSYQANDFYLGFGTGGTTGGGANLVVNAAGAGIASGASTLGQIALNTLLNYAIGLADLYAGGIATYALDMVEKRRFERICTFSDHYTASSLTTIRKLCHRKRPRAGRNRRTNFFIVNVSKFVSHARLLACSNDASQTTLST